MTISDDMHRVAHHLQKQAIASPEDERDSYARSCYNRYYYSLFLHCRDMLSEMDPKWSNLPHASYPQVLDGHIRTAFKRQREVARRTGDKTLENMIKKATHSLIELRDVITKANTTRVVADYEPEEKVDFLNDQRFALKRISVNEAHAWISDAKTHCRIIMDAWRQTNA